MVGEILKNNTEKVKIMLSQALQQVPEDFSLIEVKNFIKAALNKINEVEKKREKRHIQQQERQNFVSLNPRAALNALDEEIAKQQEKIKEMGRKKQKQDEDDDDLQSLFD